MLEVRELGVVDYVSAWELQKRLVEERAAGRIPDTLLLLEHPHVVTCGRGFRPRSLEATPHPVHHVERGGDVTYHGPGQLVGYPIVHLRERGLTVGAWLRTIEGALIDALGALGLEGERLKGFTGVWCRGRKVASIGVAVRSWVSYHGFALNVSTDLAALRGLYPCGLQPEQLGSLSALGDGMDAGRVRREISSSFGRLLEAAGDRLRYSGKVSSDEGAAPARVRPFGL